jgi:hypothetical protein
MRSVLVVLALAAMPGAANASDIDPTAVQLWDVVHTSDGSVLKGVIVEEVPGATLKIVIVGGSTLVVQMSNVVKLGRELNPAFAAGIAPGVPAGHSGVPVPAAESGLRIGILPGVAVHSDLDSTTFLLNARIGWELGLEQWGLTPGFAALYAADTGSYGNDSFGGTGFMRAAYRASKVSPFVGFGLGVDVVSGDPSLATYMTAGIDLLVHRRLALTLEGMLRKSFAGTYSGTHQFAALGMGVEIRL